MLAHILGTTQCLRPGWVSSIRLLGVLLLLLGTAALPVEAANVQLPPVNNFATAQFKLLSRVQIGSDQEGFEGVAFGAGAVVLPDRTSAWIGTNDSSDLLQIVQIGTTTYVRQGSEPWEQGDAPFGNAQTQPISAQFNTLQANANAILDLGSANVGDVPTTHYQVWLSGDKALAISGDVVGSLPDETRDLIAKAAFKYDFWIGTQDGFLHQQLVTIMIPASTINEVDLPEIQVSILTTFFDINNPNISVNAPI